MSDTTIEWTDATWNPVTGCSPVSEGCAHCWARDLHERRHKAYLAGKPMPAQYAQPFGVVQLHEDRLQEPLHWRKGRKIAVCLGGDLFHPAVPDAFIDRVFAVMALTPQHTYQVLTKRPERMREYLLRLTYDEARCDEIYDLVFNLAHDQVHATAALVRIGEEGLDNWPLQNVWLGVSVEDQATADARIPLLLQTPAAVRFVSCGPLLGPVSFLDNDGPQGPGGEFSVLDFGMLHWVIVEGETGPGARPCYTAWIRSIVQQCHTAGVPCFVKQVGSRPIVVAPEPRWPGLLKARKGNDPAEWPEDLRVREMPETTR